MNHQPRHDSSPAAESTPTQSQVYENLKRIGELEDKKKSIQAEIEKRTEELRSSVEYVDQSSLLYKMLTSALAAPGNSSRSAKSAAPKPKPKRKAKPKKKAAKRKRR